MFAGGLPKNVWIGYKHVTYDLPNGHVVNEMWLDQTGGVPGMAVAAYYQGLMPTRAGKLYDETKRYVAGVSASRGQF